MSPAAARVPGSRWSPLLILAHSRQRRVSLSGSCETKRHNLSLAHAIFCSFSFFPSVSTIR